jgi:hypothetical protein
MERARMFGSARIRRTSCTPVQGGAGDPPGGLGPGFRQHEVMSPSAPMTMIPAALPGSPVRMPSESARAGYPIRHNSPYCVSMATSLNTPPAYLPLKTIPGFDPDTANASATSARPLVRLLQESSWSVLRYTLPRAIE